MHIKIAFLMVLATLFCPIQAQAAITLIGDFEDAAQLNEWLPIDSTSSVPFANGTASVSAGFAGALPSSGTGLARLSATTSGASPGFSNGVIETELGLNVGSLSSVAGGAPPINEGTFIYRDVFIVPTTGAEILFDYNFMTTEPANDVPDTAFWSVFNLDTLTLVNPTILAQAGAPNAGAPLTNFSAPIGGYLRSTGNILDQQLDIGLAGNYRIGFGVYGTTLGGFPSDLFIDNVRVSTVPEPGCGIFVFLGAVCVSLKRRRRAN